LSCSQRKTLTTTSPTGRGAGRPASPHMLPSVLLKMRVSPVSTSSNTVLLVVFVEPPAVVTKMK
jgi:hypothetical protein